MKRNVTIYLTTPISSRSHEEESPSGKLVTETHYEYHQFRGELLESQGGIIKLDTEFGILIIPDTQVMMIRENK